jgi:hypothetical protein
VSIPIDAPPESPGHVGHTPTPNVNLGLSLGRLHDLAGGLFGSGIVRAILGQPESEGTLGAAPMQEYAMQAFGIPGGMEPGSPKQVPSAAVQAAAHANTMLSLEESTIRFNRSGRVDGTVPQGIRDALDAVQRFGTVPGAGIT